MKKAAGFLIALALCFFLAPSVYAEGLGIDEAAMEVYDKSGAEGMYNVLDDEVKSSLNEAGINSPMLDENVSFDKILKATSNMLKDKIYAPIKAVLAILVIVILARLAQSFENDEMSRTVSLISSVVSAGVIIVPIIGLISSLKTVISAASAFLLASSPVYAGILIAGGKITTGSSYGTITIAAGNAIPVLANVVIIPLLNMFMAISLVSAVSEMKLDKLGGSMYKFSKWVLVSVVSIFAGAVSLQTLISSNIDGLSAKAVKMVASSAIPVVGGAISDTISVVSGSIDMVKSGAGAFGILASLMIFLPLLLEMILWSLTAGIGEITADLFECGQISKLISACGSVIKMTMAVLISTAAVCIICSSIIITVRSGI